MFRFGSKAETLERLRALLKSALVLPIVLFTAKQWRDKREEVIDLVARQDWGRGKLIVRSSAKGEDSKSASNAGRYLSVLDVAGSAELSSAVDRVLSSYEAGTDFEQVFVQPMLSGVTVAGVALTHDPSTRAAYRVINYVEGGDTTAITGGKTGKTYYRAKSAPQRHAEEPLKSIFALIDELEALIPDEPLDIEFARTESQLFLLQVRPLIVRSGPVDSGRHRQLLENVAAKIRAGARPHPFLHGDRTVYGVMPDWNPAEIIGIRPRPLALSLYKELVTDSIWAYQRHNYGYKNLRSFPLLVSFYGLPYIDVRVSFNSFVPRDIQGGLADRLVNYYIDCLLERPSLHDKVEFEVVFACYTLDIESRLQKLGAAGFSRSELEVLRDSVRALTNRIVHFDAGLWRNDRDRLPTLVARREQIQSAGLDPVARVYWLLEDCKRYGTLPFAGLARAGFMAVQILRSLVTVGALSEQDYGRFMTGLNTVSRQLTEDAEQLDRAAFLGKYGHLRPGTYDIESLRYDEAPEIYFPGGFGKGARSEPKSAFRLSSGQTREIGRLLEKHGLQHDVRELFDFLQAGIELREYSKFLFSRNLSDALSAIRGYGATFGFSADDMSYADIRVIYELYASAADPHKLLQDSIARGRAQFAEACTLVMPPLIVDESDVWAFHLPPTEPNFITQKSVTARVSSAEHANLLAGAIVAIPSSDPGYDWLFSRRIAGLITAYGGANSHMAIRAGELGLPAVIGAGEQMFRIWSKARILRIDCARHQVDVMS